MSTMAVHVKQWKGACVKWKALPGGFPGEQGTHCLQELRGTADICPAFQAWKLLKWQKSALRARLKGLPVFPWLCLELAGKRSAWTQCLVTSVWVVSASQFRIFMRGICCGSGTGRGGLQTEGQPSLTQIYGGLEHVLDTPQPHVGLLDMGKASWGLLPGPGVAWREYEQAGVLGRWLSDSRPPP